MKTKVNYIFFSSSQFGRFVLNKLLKNFPPLFLITKKPKPQQREKIIKLNPVAELALKKHFPFFEIEELQPEQIEKYQPLFGLIAGFGKILKKEWLEIFPLGILNIHPSLLPKFRGPSPIQATILNNEKPGVTIFLVDEGIDTGPILWQEKLPIKIDYFAKMEKELALKGAEIFLKNIESFIKGKVKPQNQQGEVILTTKISFQDAQVKSDDLVDLAWRKILAFHQEPTAWLKVKINGREKILKIFKGKKIKENFLKSLLKKEIPNKLKKWPQLIFLNNNVFLRLCDGYLLLEEVQLEGKKKMSGKEFFNGYAKKEIELV